MASVIFPRGSIDYNIVDGTPHGFDFDNKVWLDTWGYPPDRPIIEEPGWREKLTEVVTKYGFDKPGKYGLHAYIYWMQEQGLLPTPAEGTE